MMQCDFTLPCVVNGSKIILYTYNESENSNGMKAMGARAH